MAEHLSNQPQVLAQSGQYHMNPTQVLTQSGQYHMNPTQETGRGGETKRKKDETIHKNILQAAQIHLVVATLVMTVTFTAGFTLPGGFNSDINSPDKGMAILLRRASFRAFVVTDAIAFTSSAGAVFTYFTMAASAIYVRHLARELALVKRLYAIAFLLQAVAMSAVVIAFVTGGFNSDINNPDKGMAILPRRASFHAFVVTNAIAFTSSAGAVFTYFMMAASEIFVRELAVVRRLYVIATLLKFVAMSTIVIAFVTERKNLSREQETSRMVLVVIDIHTSSPSINERSNKNQAKEGDKENKEQKGSSDKKLLQTKGIAGRNNKHMEYSWRK